MVFTLIQAASKKWLPVTSHKNIWLFFEQFWLEFVPILHCLQWRFGLERGLRQLRVAEMDISHQRVQVFAVDEMVALQDVLDAAVEPLDHAVGLRMHRRRETVLDAGFIAEPVEIVAPRGGALTQAEPPIGEFAAVIGQDAGDFERAGAVAIA